MSAPRQMEDVTGSRIAQTQQALARVQLVVRDTLERETQHAQVRFCEPLLTSQTKTTKARSKFWGASFNLF